MAQFLNMYSVDLQKPTGPQPLRQMVCAGDNAANRIGAIVTSDGGTVSLGGSCVGKVVRADGTTVQLSGTISGNQAYVVLDQASCAIVGQIQVAVCWVSGSSVTTLVIAYGSVVSTQTGSPVQPSTPIPDLTQLLAEIENMRTATAAATAAATGALANFAGAFVQATAYPAGTYVTYTDGKFYRLTADHAANVTWANTSKVAVTTGGELSDLKSALNTSVASVATPFSELTAPILMGTLCTRNNKVYRANQYIATAEWTNAYFDEIPIATVINNNDEEISAKMSDSFGMNGIAEKILFTLNRFIDLGGETANVQKYRVTSSTLMCAVVPCASGDKFYIKAVGGSTSSTLGARAYGFIKSDGTVLSVANEYAGVDGVFTAPANSAYLVINDRLAYKASYKGTLLQDLLDSSKDSVLSEVDKYKVNNLMRVPYSDAPEDTGYIKKTDGSIESYNYGIVSDFIECPEGSAVNYNIYAIGNISCAVAFYNAEKTLIDKVYSPTGEGTWVLMTGTTNAPSGTKYIRYGMKKNAKEQYIEYVENTYPKNALSSKSFENPWYNKKWIAFGTSLTDGTYIDKHSGEIVGKYPKYLRDMSGMILTNRGYAGASIGVGGLTGGNGYIYNCITSTNLTGADLITVEGFVNDFNYAIHIGEVGDTTQTTFCGALYMGLTYLMQNSTATIAVITDSTGKAYTFPDTGTSTDFGIARTNNAGDTQKDYIDATKAVCEYLSVPCIDAGCLSEICQFHPDYIIDHIHHTELGGKQYAQTIWAVLKNMKPRLLTV